MRLPVPAVAATTRTILAGGRLTGEASRHYSREDPNQCTLGPTSELHSRPTWRGSDGGGGGGGSHIHRRTDEQRDSRHFQAPVSLSVAPPGEAKGSGQPFMAHHRYFHH